MKIDGGCHCGFLKYEAEASPEKAGICHCTDCQQLSGSAFRTIAPAENFRFVAGTPTIYIKTGDSGNPREQSFCPRCGSPIYAAPPGPGPKIYNIRVGTMRQREQFVPTVQFWARSKQRWVSVPAAREVEKQ